MQRSVWQCLCLQNNFNILTYDLLKDTDCHVPALFYKGQKNLDACGPGEDYETNEKEVINQWEAELSAVKLQYQLNLKRLERSADIQVALAYDDVMMKHQDDEPHPEDPMRICEIYDKHKSYGLLERVHQVASRKATDEELALVHDQEHLDQMKLVEEMGQKERDDFAETLNSIYLNDQSYNCALVATGNLLNVTDKVCDEEAQSGEYI